MALTELLNEAINDFNLNYNTHLGYSDDIPFSWLIFPKSVLMEYRSGEYWVEGFTWLRPIAGTGILLSILAALFCLFVLPKGTPGKRRSMLLFFCAPILIDCMFHFNSEAYHAIVFAMLPIVVCLVSLVWKTVSLLRPKNVIPQKTAAVTAYSIGMLGVVIAFTAMLTFIMPVLTMAVQRTGSLTFWEWVLLPLLLPLSIMPEIGFAMWFFPFNRIENILNCLSVVGGVWYLNVACMLILRKRFGEWKERRPILFCMLWFMFLFRFSTAFWIGGYSLRPIVYSLGFSAIAILWTFIYWMKIIAGEETPGYVRRATLLGITVLAQIPTWIWMFYSISSSSYCASV